MPRPEWIRAGRAAALAAVVPASAQAASGLNLIPDLGPLLTILIGFVILLFPLNSLIFKPLFAVLDERENRISGSRRRGENLQQEAEEALRRYETSIGQVRAEAEVDRRAQLDLARQQHGTITAAARGEAEREIERGRQSIRQSLEEARVALRSETEQLARDAASQILGRSVS